MNQPVKFRKAFQEGRQPMCVYCRAPLDGFLELGDGLREWRWDASKQKYIESVSVNAWRSRPACDKCGTEDLDFVDSRFVEQ